VVLHCSHSSCRLSLLDHFSGSHSWHGRLLSHATFYKMDPAMKQKATGTIGKDNSRDCLFPIQKLNCQTFPFILRIWLKWSNWKSERTKAELQTEDRGV
jgi:hypothetical protein